MPVIDGYDAARVIRNDLKLTDIPFNALSADAMEGTELHAKNAGMDEYITKPIDPKVLYSQILKLLNKKNNS